MNRQETWEASVDAIETRFLRTEFGEGEFRVEHNDNAGTITIIHQPTGEAMQLLDVTGSYMTGGSGDERVVVHLPTPAEARRMRLRIAAQTR